MQINELVQLCHQTAKAKGFWEASDNIGEKLMLIVTEVAEAMEELRKEEFNEAAFNEELADILIRTFDLAGYLNLDLGNMINRKMDKNKKRPYLHGKVR